MGPPSTVLGVVSLVSFSTGRLGSDYLLKHALYDKLLKFDLSRLGVKQEAQLSQRDRAAGCVIVFDKSRRLELEDNIYGHYRSIFNYCDIIGLKICRIR